MAGIDPNNFENFRKEIMTNKKPPFVHKEDWKPQSRENISAKGKEFSNSKQVSKLPDTQSQDVTSENVNNGATTVSPDTQSQGNQLSSKKAYVDCHNPDARKGMKDKFILDACCGMKYMWYNKQHPNTLYMDIRKEEKGFNKNRPFDAVQPDIQGDFTKLPEEIKQRKFKLIVWDVPHFKGRKLTGNLLKCFGALNPETWQSDINKGFNELWSVLDDYGVLLFKFSDYHIKFKDVLKQIPQEPLFFNRTTSKGVSETKWFCFMKIPKEQSAVKTE